MKIIIEMYLAALLGIGSAFSLNLCTPVQFFCSLVYLTGCLIGFYLVLYFMNR